MNYYELQDFCEKQNVTVTNVARSLGLTLEGLKKGLNNESLSIRYMKPLCEFLSITPNDFFSVKSQGDVNCNKYGQNQTINQIPTELKDTIEILRNQLEEKDNQINNLISKLK